MKGASTTFHMSSLLSRGTTQAHTILKLAKASMWSSKIQPSASFNQEKYSFLDNNRNKMNLTKSLLKSNPPAEVEIFITDHTTDVGLAACMHLEEVNSSIGKLIEKKGIIHPTVAIKIKNLFIPEEPRVRRLMFIIGRVTSSPPWLFMGEGSYIKKTPFDDKGIYLWEITREGLEKFIVSSENINPDGSKYIYKDNKGDYYFTMSPRKIPNERVAIGSMVCNSLVKGSSHVTLGDIPFEMHMMDYSNPDSKDILPNDLLITDPSQGAFKFLDTHGSSAALIFGLLNRYRLGPNNESDWEQTKALAPSCFKPLVLTRDGKNDDYSISTNAMPKPLMVVTTTSSSVPAFPYKALGWDDRTKLNGLSRQERAKVFQAREHDKDHWAMCHQNGIIPKIEWYSDTP